MIDVTSDISDLIEWTYEHDDLDLLETNPERTFLTVENVSDADTAAIAELCGHADLLGCSIGRYDDRRDTLDIHR